MKVRSSFLSIDKLNLSKKDRLKSFICDYKKAVLFYMDYLFNNEIIYHVNDKKVIFDIKNDKLDCPNFISNTDIAYNTDLSARALKCAVTQACSIVKSCVKKRKSLLFVFNELKINKKRTRSIVKKLNKTKITKPNINNIYPELNSICCKYYSCSLKSFDNVIVLSSLGKKYGKIIIPAKHSKHSRKLEKKGILLNSFQILPNKISIRYKLYSVKKKTKGIIVGADQGINTCLTLSDHQITKKDKHGNDLNSILRKISRKKKGSKLFHKALEHRNNYINWSINQLNFSNIKEVRLEKITNFRHKKNVGSFLNYFGEALIKNKLLDIAEENGVRVVQQSSAYRSQRCSHCGYVCRKNREGKNFSCKHCSFQADADYNASCNHEISLPSSENLGQLSNKHREFFWKENGFFDLKGQEFTVPDTKKVNILV